MLNLTLKLNENAIRVGEAVIFMADNRPSMHHPQPQRVEICWRKNAERLSADLEEAHELMGRASELIMDEWDNAPPSSEGGKWINDYEAWKVGRHAAK